MVTGAIFGRMYRLLFGHDVFISYGRADATEYALALGVALTEAGISCYIDQWGSSPGREVGADVLRNARHCTVLVAIGSEAGERSDAVRREIREFRNAGGQSVVPVSFGGPVNDPQWLAAVGGIAPAVEPQSALVTGAPTPRLIERIVNAEGFTRRNVRLRRIALATAAVFLLLLAGSGVLLNMSVRTANSLKSMQGELSRARFDLRGANDSLEETRSTLKTATDDLRVRTAALERTEDEVAEQQRLLERRKREALAQQLVASSIAARAEQPQAAISYAIQAVNATLTRDHTVLPAAEQALHESVLASTLRMTLYCARTDEEVGPATRVFGNSSNAVLGVSYSPDGNVLATVGLDQPLRLWDARTGTLLPVEIEGDEESSQVAFSADGTRIATAGNHGVAVRGASGELLYAVPGHVCAFSSDGRLLATGGPSSRSALTIFDAATGRQEQILAHGVNVAAIAFSPDGKLLATADDVYGKVTFWDVETCRRHHTIDAPLHASSLRFADHETIIAASALGAVMLPVSDEPAIPLSRRAPVGMEFIPGVPASACAAVSPDGELVATAGDGSTLQLVRTDLLGPPIVLHGHTGNVLSVAFRPDGLQLASAGNDGTVRLWDLGEAPELPMIDGAGPVAFSADGNRIALANGEIFDVRRGRKVGQLSESDEVLAVSPDWRSMVVNTIDGNELRSVQPEKTVARLRDSSRNSLDPDVRAISFSGDGAHVAVHRGTGVDLWDVRRATRRSFRDLDWSDSVIALSVDGRRFATVTGEDTLTVVDTRSGAARFFGGHEEIEAVAFSPDSRTIATAAGDGSLKLWDVDTRRCLATVAAHTRDITGVAFSPDSRRVATTGKEGSLKVWDARSGEPILELAGAGEVVFSHDGKMLAAGGMDPSAATTVYFNDVTELLRLAEMRAR